MPKFLILTLLAAMTLFAKDDVLPHIYQDDGVAVKGTDVVAYFTDNKQVDGVPEYTYTWKGAKWQFASQEHLDLFKANPEKYAPQYGGYCAYAVAKNGTASITPRNWKIVDGKLYLNHAFAHWLWKRHIPDNIEKADNNWPAIEKTTVQ